MLACICLHLLVCWLALACICLYACLHWLAFACMLACICLHLLVYSLALACACLHLPVYLLALACICLYTCLHLLDLRVYLLALACICWHLLVYTCICWHLLVYLLALACICWHAKLLTHPPITGQGLSICGNGALLSSVRTPSRNACRWSLILRVFTRICKEIHTGYRFACLVATSPRRVYAELYNQLICTAHASTPNAWQVKQYLTQKVESLPGCVMPSKGKRTKMMNFIEAIDSSEFVLFRQVGKHTFHKLLVDWGKLSECVQTHGRANVFGGWSDWGCPF